MLTRDIIFNGQIYAANSLVTSSIDYDMSGPYVALTVAFSGGKLTGPLAPCEALRLGSRDAILKRFDSLTPYNG